MHCVVGADQEIGTDFCEFICRREHQLTHALPISAVDALHVLAKRVRVHRDLGMIVGAEKLRAFHADGSITKRRALGGAGNNTNVVEHDLILQNQPPSQVNDRKTMNAPKSAFGLVGVTSRYHSMRASEEALRSKHLQLSWDLHSQTNYLILSALNFCSVLNLSSPGGRCDEGRL